MAELEASKRSSIGETFLRDFFNNLDARGTSAVLENIKDNAFRKAVEQSRTINGLLKTQAFYNGYGSRGNVTGGYRSGGAQWPHGLSRDGRARTINHTRMRRNSRDAYHDSPQARAIVDRFADTVADIALVLECSPKASILGISPERAKAWARDVEARFDLWARDKRAHRSETMTFYQKQHLYQVFQHRDNDMFTRLYYSSDRMLQNPLQWEFLDPDQIRGYGYTGTNGPYMSNVPDGIVRDERGREKAYHVYVRDGQGGKFKNVTVQRKGPKSGRLFMLHGYKPEYAGQGRGYSRIGFALQSLENITDFSMAQIKKAINQSSIIAMMENKELDPSNVFEGMLTNFGKGAAAQQFGSQGTPSSSALNVTTADLTEPECFQLPEATLDVPGSTMILNAKRGDSLKPFAQAAPADSFDKFVDAFMYYLAAAAGIPLEVVLMRFNQNYSASRSTLILFWRVVMMWREEWAADDGNPTYEMWLSGEIAAGRIQAPGFADPILRAAWLHCTWRGAPIPDIDPSKTAKARRENLSIGATTLEREARDLNGSDAESNLAQLEHEYGAPVPPPWEKQSARGGEGNPDAIAEAVVDEIELRQED
jgi:capsid protein